MNNKKLNYIAIEGCIGVGKTTLSNELANKLNGSVLLETFETNPFLADFYKDISAFAFKTQIFFLLSRYKQQQGLDQRDLFKQAVISDYFIAKDHIFAQLTLTDKELTLYEQLYQTLCPHIHVPDLIIYLRAPLPVVLERIAKRGRDYEKDIDPKYLKDLGEAYDKFFSTFTSCPVLTVETEELDFPNKESDVNHILDMINDTLNKGKQTNRVNTGIGQQTKLFK
ncbi:MAG: deoxynucleoside kinase [bacterium]|nr:deoxynucleoside kinase [bacterium]